MPRPRSLRPRTLRLTRSASGSGSRPAALQSCLSNAPNGVRSVGAIRQEVSPSFLPQWAGAARMKGAHQRPMALPHLAKAL
jgi:hypothetical protein